MKVKSEEVVPPAVVGHLRDQWSASPESVEYLSVTFGVDGLVGALHQQLDQCGYTAKLHSALVETTKCIEAAGRDKLSASAKEQVYFVHSALVTSNSSNAKLRQQSPDAEEDQNMDPNVQSGFSDWRPWGSSGST